MTSPSADSPLTLRPTRPEDRTFLSDLYASTRAEELAPVPWSPEQKLVFLTQQFEAQDRDYRGRFPAESFQVIERDGHAIGRLYVHRTNEQIELIDIALLPAERGQGLGTQLLRELLAEADASARPVQLYVEKFNRALGLYRRFDFQPVEDFEVYLKLQRAPQPGRRA